MLRSTHRILLLSTTSALLLLAACGGGDGTPPEARVPAHLLATTPTLDTIEVGLATATAPTVKVTDAAGRAIAGVVVHFDVGGAGASVVRTQDTSDTQGLASADGWTIGGTPGRYEVSARVDGLEPLQFVAIAQVGAPAIVTDATEPLASLTSAYTTFAPAARVRVTDRMGNPLEGVDVSFSVVEPPGFAPGSTIERTIARTDAQGIASPGAWLPRTNESHQLLARVGSTGPSVTLQREVQRGCLADRFLILPAIVNDTISGNDAVGCGVQQDLFGVESGDRIVSMRVWTDPSPTGAPYVDIGVRPLERRLIYPGGTPAALNPYMLDRMRVLAPPGDYAIMVWTHGTAGGVSGGERLLYTLHAESLPESVTGCEPAWVRVGLSTNQDISATDCDVSAPEVGGAMRADEFKLRHMGTAERRFTATVTAEGFEPRIALYYITLFNQPPVYVASDTGTGSSRTLDLVVDGTTSELMFRVLAPAGTTGKYHLDLTSTP